MNPFEKKEKQKIIEYNTQKNLLLELQEIINTDNTEGQINTFNFVYQNAKNIFKYSNLELVLFFESDKNAQNLIELLSNVKFLHEIDYLKDKLKEKEEGNIIDQAIQKEILNTINKSKEILKLEKKIEGLKTENKINTESLYDEVEKNTKLKEKLEYLSELLKNFKNKIEILKIEKKKYIDHISKIGNTKTPKSEEIKRYSYINNNNSNIIKKSKFNKKPEFNKNNIDFYFPKETFIFLEQYIEKLEEKIANIENDTNNKIEDTENKYLKELIKQKKYYTDKLDEETADTVEAQFKSEELKKEIEELNIKIQELTKIIEKQANIINKKIS